MSGIPTTGAVTMTALNTNFSGGNSLSGYRNKTIYNSSTNEATIIPGSGTISFSTFRGKRALAPPGAIATAPVISLLRTTGATVTWSVSANATSYVLSIGTTQGATNTYAATNVGNATSATIGAVFLGGTSYFASVYGVNAGGNGTANQNPTAYILCAAPTNVNLESTGLTWTITWTAAPFATGYSWALSTSSTNATSLYTGTVGSLVLLSSPQTPALSPSTTYYAFVYATRTESISPYGSFSYTTPALSVATATKPTIAAGVLTYTWSGTNTPQAYIVKLYKTGDSTALQTINASSILLSSTYSSLTIGATYYTTVTARNAGGVSSLYQSPASDEYNPPIATAATPTVATVPYSVITGSSTYPTPGITITAINTGTLNWASLQVYYTSGQFNYIRTGPATTAPGGKYSFTMPTVGAGYSLILNAGVGAPSYATGYKEFKKSGSSIIYTSNDTTGIISVNTGGGLGLTYTWGASSGNPTGYTVNLYSTAAPSTPLATLTNTTTTSATYPAVSGTSYYITVIATNAKGNSNTVTSGTVTA